MKQVSMSRIVQAATQSPIAREILKKEMKRRGLTRVRAGHIEARLEPREPRGVSGRTVREILDSINGCKVAGCGSKVLAKGLCQKHYGRARRKQPLDVEPRRGLVQLVIHVDPALKRWLKKTAKRDKSSVSQRAAMLLQSEMDNLNGKSPF